MVIGGYEIRRTEGHEDIRIGGLEDRRIGEKEIVGQENRITG